MKRISTATAILLAAVAAYAMSDIDADADGALSMAELKAAYPDLTEAQFDTADSNSDGMISEIELAQARAAGVLPDDRG